MDTGIKNFKNLLHFFLRNFCEVRHLDNICNREGLTCKTGKHRQNDILTRLEDF